MVSMNSAEISTHKSATSTGVRLSSPEVLPLRSVAVGLKYFFSCRVVTRVPEYCLSFSWTAGEALPAPCSAKY